MCGIVGFINYGNNRLLNQDYLVSACRSIVHRGPDDEGTLILEKGQAGIGMRRLSIIDLSTGTQPMLSDDGRIAIVLNGEIYNYIELRTQLSGVSFKSQSDTEVLLKLYERYGTDCFGMTRGMFGVAIWDGHKQAMIIARDRFGKKPLYYYKDGGCIVFGSEIKSILTLPTVPRRLSFRALDHYLSWLAVPDPDTMFERIHKLPPGHYMQVALTGKTEMRRYWHLEFPDTTLAADRSDAKDLLIENLEEAIRIRLRADVPVGILLSGGVDSSAIVALASKHSSSQLKTYSIGFDIEGYNEFDYSRAVSERYKTKHTEEVMPASSYWHYLEQLIWHLDEPMADTATVPLYYICSKAKGEVKVLLSGEGSDEMLAGYAGRYLNALDQMRGLSALGRRLPVKFKDMLWAKLAGGSWPSVHQSLWKLTKPPEYQFLKNSIYGYYEGLRDELYRGGPLEDFAPEEKDLLERISNNGRTPLQRMIYTDSNVNLPAYLLMKADKMSMAASIELRCPFLDHVLAEFCASLPDEYKLDTAKKEGKSLLKQALEPYLPLDLLYRNKMGFPVPIDYWLKTNLKNSARDVLLSPGSRISQFLNMGHVTNMWKAHQEGRLNFGMQLWLLVLLELWMQRFGVEI